MIKPRYQDFLSAKIPVAQTEDGTIRVKVIAGEALGADAVIETRIPILYLHFTLQLGAEVIQPVPSAYNTFAYIINGEGLFGTSKQSAKRRQMVIFAKDDKEI